MHNLNRKCATVTQELATKDEDDEEIGFLHAILAQCGLPRNPTNAREFKRSNGSASLLLEAGKWWNGRTWVEQPLPSGTRPRLTLIHACSEAVRTRSREIEVEHSVRAFLRRLGVDQGGKTMKGFRQQMLALTSCRMMLGYTVGAKGLSINKEVNCRFGEA
jgi:hypothetical protein